MSILTTIEAEAQAGLTVATHAVDYLIGMAATSATSLHDLENDSPLVADAIEIGKAKLTAMGIDLPAIETTGEEVLQLAKQTAAALTAAPTPAAAPAPPAAA